MPTEISNSLERLVLESPLAIIVILLLGFRRRRRSGLTGFHLDIPRVRCRDYNTCGSLDQLVCLQVLSTIRRNTSVCR
jgi:hypothetical protein